MANKVVKAEHALQHKGAKAPRPEKSMKADNDMASKAPNAKGKAHACPAGPFKYPDKGEQSEAPDAKKKALTLKEAPKGVQGVNGGKPMFKKPKGNSNGY
jgi:hypothetical protein